jgi:Type IV secretion system pilin
MKEYIRHTRFLGIALVGYLGVQDPSVVHAADTLKSIIEVRVLPILSSFINLILTLSVLMFIVGVIRFMYTAGDDKSRSEGKQLMLWGTIALFVMVTVWGVVGIIKTTFFG